MEIKNKIKPNEELYGDFADKLIPLNLDGVQQRIDFFRDKADKSWSNNDEKLQEYYEAMLFWEGIKREHCEVEV